MNRKSIKYLVASLIIISCISTVPKTTVASANPFPINNLESSTSYAHHDDDKKKEDKKDKHNGFNIFSEDNYKYLSSAQKKDLLELKKCKDKGDTLSKEQQENLHLIITCIFKGKLGDEKYEDFKGLIEKKKTNVALTEEEDKKLKEYRAIIDTSKPSTKDIIKQFLR